MRKWISRLIGAFAGLTLAHAAWADLPHGTLQFLTPNVTAGPNDPVQIWVRLTLDADSPAFSFSSNPLTGISAADLSPEGYRYDSPAGPNIYENFAQINAASISAAMGCCSDETYASYTLAFGSTLNPDVPGPVYQDHFNLGPGQSYDYLFAQLTPKAGGATAGTYSVGYAQMTLDYSGVDSSGNWLAAVNRPVIAGTCGDLSNGACTFTFTVAVPEPASYVLLGLGLVAVGFLVARREVRVAS